jgi:hypothetical protein
MDRLSELFSYQTKGVLWLLERPKGMLAWEMGTGKTPVTVRAWEMTREQGPLLVVCPNTAMRNWKREIERFALDIYWPPKVEIFRDSRAAPSTSADVIIINYEKLINSCCMHALQSRWGRWGAIVFDEGHRLKTTRAKVTRAAYGPAKLPLVECSDRIWLATGTPMPNHPGELYSHAQALWADRIQYGGHVMKEWEWQAAFCEMRAGDYGVKIVGAKNLDELRDRLSPVISVLKRRDVLDLPPCVIDVWPLDEGAARFKIPQVPGLLGTLEDRYGALQDIDIFDADTLGSYLACIHAALLPLPSVRRETAQLKAIYAALTASQELDDDAARKMVIFAIHREALATLEKGLSKFKPAVVHGDVPEKKRQAEIDRFQNDPACRVFIGQLTAAGSSINLQAANEVLFVEASWVPGDNSQALSRVYRNGQKKPVTVRFMYLPGSIDEAVMRANKRKLEMVAKVF